MPGSTSTTTGIAHLPAVGGCGYCRLVLDSFFPAGIPSFPQDAKEIYHIFPILTLCELNAHSVKWVGLFTITTIGVCVLKYLQEARTHLYVTTVCVFFCLILFGYCLQLIPPIFLQRNFSKQFVALFVCLLIYPVVMYVCLHALDFYLLPNSGSGNAWVSPQFQMTLHNHDVQPVMAGKPQTANRERN